MKNPKCNTEDVTAPDVRITRSAKHVKGTPWEKITKQLVNEGKVGCQSKRKIIFTTKQNRTLVRDLKSMGVWTVQPKSDKAFGHGIVSRLLRKVNRESISHHKHTQIAIDPIGGIEDDKL